MDIHIDVSDYYMIHRFEIYADELVISAHGGYTNSTKIFWIPNGVEFVFYCHNGHSLQDPQVRSLMVGRGRPFAQRLSDGQICFNYELSKFQGRHGGYAEDYAEIANAITYARVEYPKMLRGGGDGPAQPAMDVLTVRYRPLRLLHTGNLKEAVLWALTMHPYRKIHCNFCRALSEVEDAPVDRAQWPQNFAH